MAGGGGKSRALRDLLDKQVSKVELKKFKKLSPVANKLRQYTGAQASQKELDILSK